MKSNADRNLAKANVTLIASDDESPLIRVKPGTRFEAVSVSIVTPEMTESAQIAARLCGGTSTCVALIDIGAETRPSSDDMHGPQEG